MNKRLKAKIFEVFGSQADFAKAIGHPESTVSRVVRGRRVLPKKERKRWAESLHCDVAEIFPETSEGGS
ncbi:MAG: helix-turn-helix domain-containing protein [Deltaproteobacteria bacterium]|nr:helix-turn-helix domain-containing protein [Deltaproteobacteria bacterium]